MPLRQTNQPSCTCWAWSLTWPSSCLTSVLWLRPWEICYQETPSSTGTEPSMKRHYVNWKNCWTQHQCWVSMRSETCHCPVRCIFHRPGRCDPTGWEARGQWPVSSMKRTGGSIRKCYLSRLDYTDSTLMYIRKMSWWRLTINHLSRFQKSL